MYIYIYIYIYTYIYINYIYIHLYTICIYIHAETLKRQAENSSLHVFTTCLYYMSLLHVYYMYIYTRRNSQTSAGNSHVDM